MLCILHLKNRRDFCNHPVMSSPLSGPTSSLHKRLAPSLLTTVYTPSYVLLSTRNRISEIPLFSNGKPLIDYFSLPIQRVSSTLLFIFFNVFFNKRFLQTGITKFLYILID